MPLAVANKVSDVHKGAFQVWPNRAPVACSRGDDYAQADIGIRGDDVFVTGLWVVVPGNRDHIFRKNGKQFRILDRDISPEHELLVIGLHDLENFLEMFEIHAAETLLRSEGFRLAEANLESLVETDVKQRPRKQGNNFAVNLPNKIVGFGIGGREYVPVRHLGEIGINFILQKLMKMPEGLLLGQERDVVLAGVLD